MNNKTRINELESLRGIFALLIVIFHFPFDNIIYNNQFIKNSFFAVDFFFVLSGYVIGKNYENKINSFDEVKIFIKRRFFRIYPLHFVFLIIFSLIEISKIIYTKNLNIYPNHGFNDFYDFILNLFLIHGFTNFSFNEPSWSISTEFATYCIFALFVCILKKNKFFLIILIFIGLILINFNFFEISFSQLGRCIFGFYLGYLSFLLASKIDYYKNNSLLSLFLIIFICYLISLDLNNKFIFLPILFSVFIMLIVTSNKNNFINKILNIGLLKYFGKISYSLYMTHFFIAYSMRQILHFVFKFEISNGMLKLGLLSMPILFFYFIVVIFISNYTYVKIETKYRLK